MDLRYSKDLIETPDFRGVPRLERLHLSRCNNLVEIHPSIGQLSWLIILDLEYCVSLIDLPSMSSKMESLKILKLCGCSKIGKIPEFKGIMRSLSELHMDKTTIEKLPSSIEFLTALTLLSLRDCQYLTSLPRNKNSLRSLEKLVVIGCSKLNDVPEQLRSIKCLEHDLNLIAFRQPLDRNVSVRCRSLSPTFQQIRIGYTPIFKWILIRKRIGYPPIFKWIFRRILIGYSPTFSLPSTVLKLEGVIFFFFF